MKSKIIPIGQDTTLDDGSTARAGRVIECVFCTGHFGPYYDNRSGEPVALIHTIPYCERFESLDVEDFLHETAVKLGLVAEIEGQN